MSMRLTEDQKQGFWGYKTSYILNSTEYEIQAAHEY